MKILITNFRLAERTASEVFVADAARALRAGGHEVAIFVSKRGKLAQGMEEEGFEIRAHPREVSFRPDLIHGQYNLETMAALMEFPERPAVYMSHGTRQWREHPPVHPRILRYLGTSTGTGDWLRQEIGIPRGLFRHVTAFIDVGRFEEVRRLPEVPVEALYYDRSSSSGRHMEMVREACRRCGVTLKTVDDLIGKVPTRPEIMLPRFDLVFASGRSAMEALAAGCGVITARAGRWGRLVTSENFEELRSLHFGVETLGDPQEADDLVAEIESWDWRLVAPVARRLRGDMSAEALSEALMEIYREVIEENAERRGNARSELPAIADWLIKLADQHHLIDSGFLAIQHRASSLRNVREASESRVGILEHQLEIEKEKVRTARRLLKDGSVVHQRLRKRIENEWREIEGRPLRTLSGTPVPSPGNEGTTGNGAREAGVAEGSNGSGHGGANGSEELKGERPRREIEVPH